jgi:hypothetical protein
MKLRFVRDNLAPLAATTALLVALICWFGTTVPVPQTPPPQPAEQPWRLPALAQHEPQKSIATINTRNLWGDQAATAPKEPEWRIVGIASRGTERLVLLSFEGKPIATLKLGDALPDDSKIVQIENDRFFVMTPGKKKLAYGLYKHDQIK